MRTLIALTLLTAAASPGAVNYDTGWSGDVTATVRAAISGEELQTTSTTVSPEREKRIVVVVGQDPEFDKRLATLLPTLSAQKWDVGTGRDAKIQVLYAGNDHEEIVDILGRVPKELPLLVKLEHDAPVREIKPGCGLPIDGWSIYWLYTGEHHAKDPRRKVPVTVKTSGSYPVRGNWWSHSDGNLRHHLQTGQHRGKFDGEWLNTLSNAELESLHSDDHEGRVHWASVHRFAAVSAEPVQQAQVPVRIQQPVMRLQQCPGGNCPTWRQLF